MTVAEFLNHFVYYPDTIYYEVSGNNGSNSGEVDFNILGVDNEEVYNKFIAKYGDFNVVDWEASDFSIDIKMEENI